MLTRKQAFDLVVDMADATGGGGSKSEVLGLKEHLIEDDFKKYKTSKKFMSSLNARTDISQDLKWDLDCQEPIIKVLFALVTGEAQ